MISACSPARLLACSPARPLLAACCLLLAIAAVALAAPAIAQPIGDGNQDGLFTGADLPTLEGCLTGPSVVAAGSCAAFDADVMGTVDLADFLQLQPGIQRGLFDCIDAHYAGAHVPVSGLLGVAAVVDMPLYRLCDETDSQITQACVAWIGVTRESTDLSEIGSAQVGLVVGRGFRPGVFAPPAPNPQTFFKSYLEVYFDVRPGADADPNRYIRLWFPAPQPNSPVFFLCNLEDRPNGKWRFVAVDPDTLEPLFPSVLIGALGPSAYWANNVGSRADFNTEMKNAGDWVPGSSGLPTVFAVCQLRTDSGGALFVPAMITANDVHRDRFTSRSFIVAEDVLEVWDARWP